MEPYGVDMIGEIEQEWAPVLPSVEDLDAVSEEDQARNDTAPKAQTGRLKI